MDERPIAEARADLSALASMVQYGRNMVLLTRRGKPQAAVVPVDVAEAVEALGGPDAAIKIMRQAAGG